MGCASSTSLPPKFHEQYNIGKLLDEGNFGKIYLVERSIQNQSSSFSRRLSRGCDHGTDAALASQQLCVKVLKPASKHGASESEQARWAAAESSVWRQIGQHDNCVELIHTFVQNKIWYMVMEKCEGSFKQEWTRVQQLLRHDSTRMFREMTLGVAHLHQLGVVHRDIKVENFLLGGPLGETVKLGDFGFATRMPASNMLTGAHGTPPYMSPEMVAGKGYDCKTDVWSLGCVIHVILCESYPYEVGKPDATAMKKAIVDDSPKLDLSWADEGEGRLSFLKHMLERTRDCRYTSEQILVHPSISQTNNQSRLSLSAIRLTRKRLKAGLLQKDMPIRSPPVAGGGGGDKLMMNQLTDSSTASFPLRCTEGTDANSVSSVLSNKTSL
eukprot:TRINITY_DN23873_c0_g1_i1.p1 TRINITY_DN23873_c0_g1~~TRINITY_DN23873_c0_g1_i1.p1  ORF type:complete len:384 (-),score=36.52 TRINITY_DN23873_c0_g1_i1:130-1281(-)